MDEPLQPATYQVDATFQRFTNTVIGGSPLRLFRLTDRGAAEIDRIVAGQPVGSSTLLTALLDAGAVHPRRPALRSQSHPAVTIVMPAFGQRRHDVTAKNVNEGVHAGTAGAVIVVDDGSQPPLANATIRLPVNRGPAAARNHGLAGVKTELVAFVDTDVALPAGWLDALVPHFDDPTVGFVAPRVSSAAGRSRLARYESTASPLDLGSQPARIAAGTRVSYVPAAALLCRTSAVRAVGGFDETLRVGEDVDLCWRLADAGWRGRYEPASTVYHAPRPSWKQWLVQRIGYGRSAAPLATRHRGAVAPVSISGWSLATWLLAAAGRPVAAVTVGLGSAAALVGKLDDVPPKHSFWFAARGNLRAGGALAAAIRRAWWPLVGVAAVWSPAARRVLVAAFLMAVQPIRAVDDVAYSVGVWAGMWHERRAAALWPRLTSWPKKSNRR